MQETMDKYCARSGGKRTTILARVAFIEMQWGAFVTWLIEQHKPEIKITIEGGVLQDVEGLPEGWTYELNDLD